MLFQALNTISTLPFHLTQDVFRWNMFRGDIPTEQLNDQYWADKYIIRIFFMTKKSHLI